LAEGFMAGIICNGKCDEGNGESAAKPFDSWILVVLVFDGLGGEVLQALN
jgi:hypothetical protein